MSTLKGAVVDHQRILRKPLKHKKFLFSLFWVGLEFSKTWGPLGYAWGMPRAGLATPQPAEAMKAQPVLDAKSSWTWNPALPVTLDFQQAPLRAVLRTLAKMQRLNLVLSEKVQGKVTLHVQQIPWSQVLLLLLDTQGLAMRHRERVIWIDTADEMLKRERLRVQTFEQANLITPLQNQVLKLHYQRAEEIQKLLQAGGGQKVLSPRGSMVADVRTNQLIVLDTPGQIARLTQLVKALDQPRLQVSIEAQIVEAEEGFSRSLGSKLSILGDAVELGPSGAVRRQGGGRLTAANGAVYELPASPLAGFDPAAVAFTLFRSGAKRVIALELSMLEAEGRGKILSKPQLVTADRAKALIEQGNELPYQAKVGNGVSAVQFRRAGLKLEVTPQITADGTVLLDIDITKDSVGVETASGPAINTKHIQTQVHVEDGGTVAVGGILTEDRRLDHAGVPFLRSLPLVGVLFGRQIRQQRKSELLIFITPHVLPGTTTQQPYGAYSNTKFRVGVNFAMVGPIPWYSCDSEYEVLRLGQFPFMDARPTPCFNGLQFKPSFIL